MIDAARMREALDETRQRMDDAWTQFQAAAAA